MTLQLLQELKEVYATGFDFFDCNRKIRNGLHGLQGNSHAARQKRLS